MSNPQKKAIKPRQKKEAARIPADSKKSPDGEIPDFLKQFEGKSVGQAVDAMFFPQPCNEEVRKILGGLFSALYDTGVPVPEWARRASKNALKGLGLDFLADLNPDMENEQFAKHFGTVVGLMEDMQKTPAPPASRMENIQKNVIEPMTDFSKSFASKSDPVEAAAFFNQRHESKKLIDKLANPSQRIVIYLCIAAFWQEIQKFKSTRELHAWLLSQKRLNGACSIAPLTDSREIRKICTRIGLKFQNQWQKIKKCTPGGI